MPVIGNGAYRLQPIHADDVAKCFAMALEIPETICHTFELCGNDRVRYNELLDMISNLLGRSAPIQDSHPAPLYEASHPRHAENSAVSDHDGSVADAAGREHL